MEGRRLLIVGIDPGITTGFAVLDIDGNLLHLSSSKQLDLNSLISETIKFGKVVLVGTDKAKIPHLTEAFATKFGARVMSPKEDIRTDEKRAMTKNFEFSDEHQSDALASSLFAFREARALLDKIDFFAKKSKKQGISDRIKELVITKRISIKSAAGIIEKKEEEDRVMEKIVVEKRLDERDFLKLYERLKKYESELRIVKDYNNSLKRKSADFEKRLMEKYTAKTESKKTKDFREIKIRFLENRLRAKGREIEHLKSRMGRLDSILANIGNFYILKMLDTLGLDEFSFRNKILNIQRNDMLLVDNPNVFSNNVIDMLKNMVFVIVYKKPLSRKIENSLPFIFINAESLRIEEGRHFAFVEKNIFEAEKSKTDWVRKTISDYKREKEQLKQLI